MNEEKARLAAEKSRPRPKVHTRRVLMIGGIMDGKWHTHEGSSQVVDILKPLEINFVEVLRREESDLGLPLPQYERYWLDNVALYGEGLWVGICQDTLDSAEVGRTLGGWREPRITLILKAILQRDVATEMGL